MDLAASKIARGIRLSAAEKSLLEAYRSLTPKYQRYPREQAQEYLAISLLRAGMKPSS